MKYFLLLFLIFILNCKKNSISESEKIPIGEIFFYNEEVQMFEKPETSNVLKKFHKTDSVKILETKIIDTKNPDFFYYKVYFENQFGYIPTSFEIKKNMFAFLYAAPNTKAKIKASSLRIRESPDLKGKVITSVPKGEIVEILWEELLHERIDLKYDTWMKIKTKDGKIGFSYTGFLSKNLEEENSEKNYFEHYSNYEIKGFIEIVDEPIYFSENEILVSPEDESPCGKINLKIFPKKGDIHKIKAVTRIENEKFYLVENENGETCYDGYKGWISEKQVTFLEDIFKYTYEKYGSNFDKKFLDVINSFFKNELNVKTLKIENFNFKVKENYSFYIVNHNYLFYKKNENYYFLKEYNGWTAIDIDQDGNDELLNLSSVPRCAPIGTINIWNRRELKKIYELPSWSELEIKDKIIIEKIYTYILNEQTKNSELETNTNYFEIKNFELVPTKRRPKKN